MAYSVIDNQSLPAAHHGPRAARQRRKRLPLSKSDYIQKKSGEISPIVTDMNLMKGRRLRENRTTMRRFSWQLSKLLTGWAIFI